MMQNTKPRQLAYFLIPLLAMVMLVCGCKSLSSLSLKKRNDGINTQLDQKEIARIAANDPFPNAGEAPRTANQQVTNSRAAMLR